MTTFDAAESGTPEALWSATSWLTGGSPITVTPDRQLVVLAAHPDDETLGAGGLIASAAEAGCDTVIVVASDGAASHPASPTHTPSELASLREREARAAIRLLAPRARLVFLHLPDGTLSTRQPEIESALVGVLAKRGLLACPWVHDRHPDHAACARAARRVAADAQLELVEFPIWAWHWGDPGTPLDDLDPAVTTVHSLPLTPELQERKSLAIVRYVTQIHPLSDLPGDEAVLTADTLDHFTRDHEYFLRIDPSRSDDA